MGILINLLVSGFAVFAASYIVPGVRVDTFVTAIIVALVLGILNAFVKPVITLLALPITILTLGLFAIVINVLMVMLVTYIVPGFVIETFLSGLLFALVLSIISSFLGFFTK